jgi:hypothetical protein
MPLKMAAANALWAPPLLHVMQRVFSPGHDQGLFARRC